MTSSGKIVRISVAQDRATALVQTQIRTGTPYHTQDDTVRNTLQTLDTQQTALTRTTTALWRAIERNYSTETERDMVGVPWMQMTLPRAEWRQTLNAMHTEIAMLDARRGALSQAHARLAQQMIDLQHETLIALRQTYASDTQLSAETAEYLSQSQAQVLAAALSDWPRALDANAKLQALLPQIGMPTDTAVHAQTDLQLQATEWTLRDGPPPTFLKLLEKITPQTPAQEVRKTLLQAQYEIHALSRGSGSLDAALHLLDKVTTTHDPALQPLVAQAHVMRTSIAAAKGVQVRATQGGEAFDHFVTHLRADLDAFEPQAPKMRDAVATARLNLVKIQWAAHRYQEAFAAAAQVQRQYPETSAAQTFEAPHSWLYRARPDAYAPGGLIRENLSEISFSGLGAAYREAWAHTHENSSLVQYGLPTLGCVAGAAIASKFGAAAGTAAGPEGTVLGFGAGAATGCGIGAAAGKVVDWTTSAITAPEVAQSLLAGHTETTWGMTWAQMNFAAVDLATTYLLGKTLWTPAVGLTQGAVDMGAGIYNLGKYAITQPGAALSDLGSGILTTGRVSVAIAKTLATPLLQPLATVRATTAGLYSGVAHMRHAASTMGLDSLRSVASIAANLIVMGAILVPDTADATATTLAIDTGSSKLDAMIRAAARPGWDQWVWSIPVFVVGAWATGRMFWLDRWLLKAPAVRAAFANEARVTYLSQIIDKSKISVWSSLLQASLINLPWIYQQLEKDNAEPFLLAVGSFSDVAYVVGSMAARAIVQHRNGGRAMSISIEGPRANWLRSKGVVDLQKPVWRDYTPFFMWSTLFSQVNNQTLGLYFTDGEFKPWLQRNVAQPLPMYPRKIVTVFLGISTPMALTVDWVLNTYENRMLTWLFPPWSGRQNWVDGYNHLTSTTSWSEVVSHFEGKMARGIFEAPNSKNPLPWGQCLHEDEFSDFYAALSGRPYPRPNPKPNANVPPLSRASVAAVAQQVLEKADPPVFAGLDPLEQKLVLAHLAFFVKVAHEGQNNLSTPDYRQNLRLGTAAQEAIAPHLGLLQVKKPDDLIPVTHEGLLERINAL